MLTLVKVGKDFLNYAFISGSWTSFKLGTSSLFLYVEFLFDFFGSTMIGTKLTQGLIWYYGDEVEAVSFQLVPLKLP